MHEFLTIGHPQLYELRKSDIAALKNWAKSESQNKRKEGDRKYIISKYHWENLAAHFGVPPMPGLPVEAVASLLGPENVCITVTMLRNTKANAWVEASPVHPPAKDEASARDVKFTVEQWNAMFPDQAIDVDAQKAEAEGNDDDNNDETTTTTTLGDTAEYLRERPPPLTHRKAVTPGSKRILRISVWTTTDLVGEHRFVVVRTPELLPRVVSIAPSPNTHRSRA